MRKQGYSCSRASVSHSEEMYGWPNMQIQRLLVTRSCKLGQIAKFGGLDEL